MAQTTFGEVNQTKHKEAPLFHDSSLNVMAKVISFDKLQMIIFFMYLNIPTTTIINHMNKHDVGVEDNSDGKLHSLSRDLIFLWKEQKLLVRDRDKLFDIERAFRMVGQANLADAIRDRYVNGEELTIDIIDLLL